MAGSDRHGDFEECAERILGADFMRAKRQEAAAERAAAATAPDPAPAHATAATSFDGDVSTALCTMGFRPPEVRRAMADSSRQPAPTFDARIRAALAELRSRPSRCSEGAFDDAATAPAAA